MDENPAHALDEPLTVAGIPVVEVEGADGITLIAPHVEAALAGLEPPGAAGAQEPGEPPSLDEHTTEPFQCTGVTKSGSRCKGTLGLVDGLCSIHRGLVDHAAAARQRAANHAAATQEAKATLHIEAERSKQGVRAAIRARLAERADDIARALVDDALDRQDSDGRPRPDLHAVLRAIEQAHGRPSEEPVEPPSQAPLTWEEQVAMLVAAMPPPDAEPQG